MQILTFSRLKSDTRTREKVVTEDTPTTACKKNDCSSITRFSLFPFLPRRSISRQRRSSVPLDSRGRKFRRSCGLHGNDPREAMIYRRWLVIVKAEESLSSLEDRTSRHVRHTELDYFVLSQPFQSRYSFTCSPADRDTAPGEISFCHRGQF